jgi:hypothetical protein
LEVGAVERGSSIELVDANGTFQAKIEGSFNRIRQLTATDGILYWEVTVRYCYGESTNSRQDFVDLTNTTRIFVVATS